MYHAPQSSAPLRQKLENNLAMYPDENSEPYLDIIEHPKARGFRFRYSCEGPSHGGIPGGSSDKNKKTYPAVQIRNYTGYARIVVQLVTNEENPRLHPHSLVGKQCQNGICTVQCGPKDMTATFPNLGIQHVTKKNVAKILEERYLAAEMQLSSLNESLSVDVQNAIKDEDKKRIQAKAISEAKSIDLSVVRLMFIAYLPDSNGSFTLMLKPVISDAIFDSKSPNAATLKICRMDKTQGVASGMDEIYLLCDKVQKDDIQVRFYEEDDYDDGWEAYGDFSPTDVHRQFAIVFRTPAYKDVAIKAPVVVQVQLRRRSDGEVSDSRQFTYYPVKDDPEEIHRKRRKVSSHFADHLAGTQPNGGISRQGGGGNRYTTASGFVFQSNGGNPQNMKQQARYGPRPRAPNPQSGPVDPTLLLMKATPLKTEPRSPSSVGMNGVSSPVGSHSSFNSTPSLPESTNLQGYQSPSQQYQQHGSPYNQQSVALSPAYSDVSSTSTVPIQVPDTNMAVEMIPGTQIPLPQAIQPLMNQPQQFSQFNGNGLTNPGLQPVNVQANYVLMPAATSNAGALYIDPSSLNSIETYSLQEVVGSSEDEDIMAQPTAQVTDGDFLSDLITMITQSERTESVNTMTAAGTTAQAGQVMDIFNTANVMVTTDSTVEEGTGDDSNDKEDFTYGLDDTSDDKVEIEPSQVSWIESDSCTAAKATVCHDTTPVKVVNCQPVADFTEELDLIDAPDQQSLRNVLITITKRTACALRDFASTGDIQILLEMQRHLTDIRDKEGDTCLHLAVIHNQNEVLMALVELIQTIPGSVNIINRYNDMKLTPLHIAIHCKNAKAVKWLVDASADTLLPDSKGNTAIHLACSTGLPDLLDYMLAKTQGHIEPSNYDGMSPLHLLATQVSKEATMCIDILMKHGYFVDAGEMKSGRTILHLATEHNNMLIAGHVISEHDADLDTCTFDGLTALHIAAAKDFKQLASLFVACGADTEIAYSDEEDSTPIHLAQSDEMRKILSVEGDPGIVISDFLDTNEDICCLDPLVKMKLCRMLDVSSEGKDWYALAKCLHLGSLIGLIDDNDRSPTESLLNHFSCHQGTVGSLKAALVKMNREDAIGVLCGEDTVKRPTFFKQLVEDDDVDRLDSAIGSMTLSEHNISIPGC